MTSEELGAAFRDYVDFLEVQTPNLEDVPPVEAYGRLLASVDVTGDVVTDLAACLRELARAEAGDDGTAMHGAYFLGSLAGFVIALKASREARTPDAA